jgi:tyrosyl-tRNA synthetase
MARVEDVERHLAAFRRAAVDLIEPKGLSAKLARGRPLRVKFGMDPSSPDLHVGHAVPLLKLRDLQDLGHTIVLIVGDATAMVGDPSGRNQLRPQLTRDEVEANLVTYVDQVSAIIDVEKAEIHRNSAWFDRLDFAGLLRLAGRMTVARMMERDTFQKRQAAGEAIGIHEFLYPLLQGWDSVEVRADVEFGGTDQLFNLLVGRDFQVQEGQEPQVCITGPLIDGLDGRKMSKSYGNAVLLRDPPKEMFGKVMSLADEVMPLWFELLTRLDDAERTTVLAGHPREAKARLAEELVRRFHGAAAARDAREDFDRRFRDRELPSEIEERTLSPWPVEGLPLAVLLREIGVAPSSSDARRKIEQGGVRIDGERADDPNARIAPPTDALLLQVGKRVVLRLRAAR